MERSVAIIGVAGRFPDAPNTDQLHQNLRSGTYSLKPISDERIRQTTLPIDQEYMVRGYLDEIDKFDYKFFGISLAEAQTMDPHQRLFLQTVHETIENAGYSAETLSGTDTAVYISDQTLSYFKHADEFVPTLVTGNTSEFVAARVSRQFNLTGGVAVIDTSCSSSLVALHNACNELILGNVSQALVGGVNLELFPFKKKAYQLDDVASPDGRSIPFSAQANGMAYGESVVCVLLKPLAAALRDKDNIQAVISATAVNNNAGRAAGLTAPDSLAQAEVILKAWERAGISPLDLGFIEAHGSGTQLGDSIEIGGLNKAFRTFTQAKRICPVATIKSNIGHTRLAAGITGLVKTVLSLKHREIYPSVYSGQANPHIDFTNSAVYVNEELTPWTVLPGKKRYAAVSAIGFSGTNCHVVLSEAPAAQPTETPTHEPQLFPLSAKTPLGLLNNAKALLAKVHSMADADLSNIAYTLGVGRSHHPYRAAFLANDLNEVVVQLEALIADGTESDQKTAPRLIFLFAGQMATGNQRWFDGLRKYPVFARHHNAFLLHRPTDVSEATFNGLAFQYAYYQLLLSFGISTGSLLGVGQGKMLVDVITGKLTLSEVGAALPHYPVEEANTLDQRIQALVNREATKGDVLFVDMAVTSSITQRIQQKAALVDAVRVFEPEQSPDRLIPGLVLALYLNSFSIDWSKVYRDHTGRRIELPAYQFAQTRVWIRETATSFEQLMQTKPTESNARSAAEAMSSVQRKIAGIWKEILQIDAVSLDYHFFELGGNSLQATKVINQINKFFGIRLSFEDLFDYPLLEQFCACVEQTMGTQNRLLLVWKEVLKTDDLQPEDNFFSLGGHSLLANQILNRINKQWDYALNFEDFYAHPSVKELAAYIEGRYVRPEATSTVTTITLAPDAANYDLSNAQKRLWLLAQTEEGSLAYHESSAYIIDGKIDEKAFGKALNALVERHESLRTIFPTIDGEPYQEVLPTGSFHIDLPIIRRDKAEEPNEWVNQQMAVFNNKPFNLETGPLLRVQLLEESPKRYHLLFNVHHIVFDEWSFKVFISELSALYNAFRRNQTSPLKPLTVQYKDYTRWSVEQQRAAAHTEHEQYWLSQFAGDIPVLELPTDFARPALKTYRGDTLRSTLSTTQWQALQSFSHRQGVGAFAVVMAATQALLHRYTGQDDIVIGMPVAGREHVELENQIGFYANTAAIRTKIPENATFGEVMALVQKNLIAAQKHQAYPFDLLRNKLSLTSDLSRSPLFDVMLLFDVQGQEHTGNLFEDLQISPAGTKRTTSKFDLTFSFFVNPEKEMQFNLIYNTDLFRADTIRRMMQHFIQLLDECLNAPEVRIDQVKMLSAAESDQLITEFAAPEGYRILTNTLPELFTAQARRRPDAVALYYGDETVRYATLNERADAIAFALRRQFEAGPGQRVGLLLDRGPDMVASLLGILKTGAAYVPILPNFPTDRINQILEDADLSALITEASNQAVGLTIDAARIIDIRTLLNEVAPAPFTVEGEPDAPACILYTSGSSGKPKGVLVTHRGLVNITDWMGNRFGLTEQDVLLQKANCIFDVAARELFTSLCRGAGLVLIDEETLSDANALAATIGRFGVNSIHFTPTALSLFLNGLQTDSVNELSSLKHVLCGGETITADLVRRFYAKINVPLINEYGPTETCVTSSYYPIRPDDTFIPIGKALQGNSIYVLGQNQVLCPIGIWGEIAIAGAGLAAGYWNDPQQTAAKFIDNPYATPGFERLYRTGDSGRYLPDGNIEFKGRKDNQLKINGYRVELGDIEQTLMMHPAVREAAVTVIKQATDNAVMYAYWTATENQVADERELRNCLVEKLPTYMVPRRLIKLDAMPMTATGKIDRQALLNYRLTTEPAGQSALTTETERRMAAIWAAILNKEVASATVNFFELGGHSLKAVRVLSAVAKEFSVKMTVRDLFANPTLDTFSALVDKGMATTLLVIESVPEQAYYELSFGQRRLWALSQFDNGLTAYNIQGTFAIDGDFSGDLLEKAVNTLIERHESLRTTFVLIEGEPKQRVTPVADCAFRVRWTDLSNLADANIIAATLIRQEGSHSFKLEKGPLLRTLLIKLDPQQYLLSFTIHHIVADEWSLGVFVNEVMTLYKSYIKGIPASLPALRIQYRDYAAWQHKYLNRNASSRAYWLNQFAQEAPATDLPTDFARPVVKTYAGAEVVFTLEESLSRQLDRLGEQHNTTLFINLLAALNVLLYRYTDQTDIVVGAPVAGRDNVDLEHQVGYYLNTLALRNELTADMPFTDLLTAVRQKTLEAFNHQTYPFDQLLAELPLERDISRSPLFNVMLVVNNTDIAAASAIEADQFVIRPYHTPAQFSKFDLTFFVRDDNGAIRIHLNYNTDLFTAERAEKITDHFVTLIESILNAPETRIGELSYVSASERQQLLETFNQTTVAYEAAPIHQLFEKQAAANPSKTALEWAGGQLSYGDLNQRANQLAHHLTRVYGVGKGSIVGVRVERSEKLIISILAVLKAGAAFLPIDLNFPDDRVSFMLNDCRADVLIDSSIAGLAADVPIYLYDERDFIREATNNSSSTVTADAIMYVIYTSGSTGKPKGTQIRHTSLANYIQNFVREQEVTLEDRHFLMSSVAFDLSHTSLWVSLLNGNTLVLFPESQYPDPAELVEWIHRYRVSVLKLTPTHLNLIVNEPRFEEIAAESAVRLVVVGGEKLKPRDLERFFQFKPQHLAFVDEYGPTEATIGMIIKKIVSDTDHITPGTPFSQFVRRAVIGRPTDNHRIYILDKDGQPQGIGVWGELCISGAGLAVGYLNRPDLTADKFVENPFQPGYTMYRTGDISRWLPNGEVEFMGRKDNQIKIHGYRIEVGEIEHVLQKLDVVNDALVVIWKNEMGNDQLVAYLLVNAPTEIASIRHHLRQSLPDYMVPTHLELLENFPLTGNGKVNLKALPAPKAAEANEAEPETAPVSTEAAILKAIVSDVLGKPQVNLQDEFFALGGDSIKAIQMASRLHKKGYKLDVRTILKTPRLSDMVGQIKPLDVQIDQSPVTGSVPLTPIQADFFQLALPNPDTYVQSVLLATAHELDGALSQTLINALVKHHDALRMRFSWEIRSVAQVNEPIGQEVTVPVYDLRDEQHPEKRLYEVAERTRQGISLEKATLLQAALIKMPTYNGLLIMIHHLVVDGVSWRILLEDIETLYEQAATNQPLSLPAKTDSYKTWSLGLNQLAAETTFQSIQRKTWAKIAAIWPLLPEAHQPERLCRTVGKTSFQIDESTTQSLLTTSSYAYHTEINDLLLTALALAFHDTFGYESLPLLLEGHGREAILPAVSVERTVGWFTSMHPVLLPVPVGLPLERHLITIKETLRQVPDKGVGYGMLTQLEKQTDLVVAPVLLFNYLGQFGNSGTESSFRIIADEHYLSVEDKLFISQPITVTGVVTQGRLSIYFRYDKLRFNTSCISGFANRYAHWIQAIVHHCSAQQTTLLTPSDLSYKHLSINELESIFD